MDCNELTEIFHDARLSVNEAINDLASVIDEFFDDMAQVARKTLISVIKDVRDSSSQIPLNTHLSRATVTSSWLTRSLGWAKKHKLLLSLCFGLLGLSFISVTSLVHLVTLSSRRSKARRGYNGSRIEVVVISADLNSLLLPSMASMLFSRGFIVYIMINDISSLELIKHKVSRGVQFLNTQGNLPSNKNQCDNVITMTQFRAMMAGRNFTGLIVLATNHVPASSLDKVDCEVFSLMLAQNVMRPIQSVQTCLPQLLRNTGRIIFIAEDAQTVNVKNQDSIRYVLSCSMEASIDSLQRELVASSVRVLKVMVDSTFLSSVYCPYTISTQPSKSPFTVQNIPPKNLPTEAGNSLLNRVDKKVNLAVLNLLLSIRPPSIYRISHQPYTSAFSLSSLQTFFPSLFTTQSQQL